MIHERFWWPGIDKSVNEYVANCYSCKINKPQHQNNKAKLEPLEIGAPWTDVQSDYIDLGKMITSRGNRYILTFICRFTKWVELIAVKSTDAETAAKEFLTRVPLRWGTPRTFLADNAGSYLSQFSKVIRT